MIEIHNFVEYPDESGILHQKVTLDIIPGEITNAIVDSIYGGKHLCLVPIEIDIPLTKEAVRIPLTIRLPDGVFSVSKITRIKRNYILKNGSTYATFEMLTPFLTARQLEVISDAVADASKQYRQQLPEKINADEIRKQAKQARIIARVNEGLPENTLDLLNATVGGV